MTVLPGEHMLLDLMAREARGPRRHGLFAVWLTLRVCGGPLVTEVPLGERNQRRRFQALRKRVGTLNIPVALRRTIHDITDTMAADPSPDAASRALAALHVTARDALGTAAAAAVREAHQRLAHELDPVP